MASSRNDANEPGPTVYEADTPSGINIGKKTMKNKKWKTGVGYSETRNCLNTFRPRRCPGSALSSFLAGSLESRLTMERLTVIGLGELGC